MQIQWYPGHMAKTRKMMEENIRLVDVVVEVIDARAPYSSKNPYLDKLWQKRPRVIALNKTDLADPSITALWKKYYLEQGYSVVAIDAAHNKGVREITTAVEALIEQRDKERGSKKAGTRTIKMMITGIPNVGKSTVVNAVAKRGGAAKTGNKPGVTRDKQWIKVSDHVMLLDTPGILWPKFENNETGLNLAFIGSISDDVVNLYQLASELLDRLKGPYGSRLVERYGIDPSVLDKSGDIILEEIGRKRGHLFKGGQVDTDRTAVMVLDEFRSGKLNRISLEVPKGREGNKDAQSESRS